MRKHLSVARRWWLLAVAAIGASAIAVPLAFTSSHREAPNVMLDPAADNTDLYAYTAKDAPNAITVASNWIPGQVPANGPNFFRFDDRARYYVNFDNTGDGVADIRYRFQFNTDIRNPNSFLYAGPRTRSYDALNINQTYDLVREEYRRGKLKRTKRVANDLPVAPPNIGPKTFPNYVNDFVNPAIRQLKDGTKVFVGQRDDPFFVDLGSVFDLAGLRPFNPFHIIPLGAAVGVDGVSGFNTHSIVLQVPTAQLATFAKPTIGIYASASRQKITILRNDGTRDSNGPWQQVSRLANPLVNEVVIPLGHKDAWNAAEPEDDSQFVAEYTEPEVTALENLLYPVLDDAPESGRGDLVAVLLTGVPTLNFTGSTKADLIRLNTGIAPTGPVGTGNRLGLLAGEFAGFPNGRRLEDDVTDIELRAFACGYGPIVGPIIESFGFCAGNGNRTPNNLLGDGVDQNELTFLTTFPYVAQPHQGYEHGHH